MKRLLKPKEAAEFLGLSVRTLYNTTGPRAKVHFPIKPVRIGRAIRYDLKDLEKYVESLHL